MFRRNLGGRAAAAILLSATDLALAALFPFLFYTAFLALLMFLAFPLGFLLGRWQYASKEWPERRRPTVVVLWFLGFLAAASGLVFFLDRTAEDVDASGAMMFLAVAWAGTSMYAVALLTRRDVNIRSSRAKWSW